MQSVRLLVPRRKEYRGGDGFEVFGNGGSGAIDFSKPVTNRRVLLWSEAAGRRGHLLDGHLMLRHLDSVDRDGHLSGIHLNDEHLMPAGVIQVEVGRYVLGRFLHAVRTVDGAGNWSSDTPVTLTTVINSCPDRPGRLVALLHDAEADQLTFSFEASPKLVS